LSWRQVARAAREAQAAQAVKAVREAASRSVNSMVEREAAAVREGAEVQEARAAQVRVASRLVLCAVKALPCVKKILESR
jgi:hypothetical protein